MRLTRIGVLACALVTWASSSGAEHVDLPLVSTSPQHLKCLFSPSCAPVPSTTTIQTFPVAGAAGEGRLEVRTYEGAPGSAAEGRVGYEYRLDLAQAYGIASTPCITTLGLKTEWPSPVLDLDGNGVAGDRLFVVSGPLNSPFPTAAEKAGPTIWFYFETPVCVGSAPGNGDRTLPFGFVSFQAPVASQAQVKMDSGSPSEVVLVQTRTPNIGAVAFVSNALSLAFQYVEIVPVPGPFEQAERRRDTLMSRLQYAEALAGAGRIGAARLTLERIRSVIDGDGEDWIVDVRDTREDERQVVLSLVDLAIRGLAGQTRDQRDQRDGR